MSEVLERALARAESSVTHCDDWRTKAREDLKEAEAAYAQAVEERDDIQEALTLLREKRLASIR